MDKDVQKEIAKAAIQFMLRVPLKGDEVQAFSAVMRMLEGIVLSKESECKSQNQMT